MLNPLNSVISMLAVLAAAALCAPAPAIADDDPFIDWEWDSISQPCDGECRVGLFAGPYVDTGLGPIVRDPIPPWDWKYDTDDYLVAAHMSRKLISIGKVVHIEPEIGVGQRFGEQHETEIWAALNVRNTWFPWNRWVKTTVAISTGINYATGISFKEANRSSGTGGDRLLHYFGPEITFALPDRPEAELMFRLHHRSGAYGFVSDTRGGSQYGTVGLNWRF